MVRIKVRGSYDLDLTMYPSFASSLFDKLGRNRWVKLYGAFKGLKLRFDGRFVESNVNRPEIVEELSGLWYDPEEHLREVSRGLRNKILPVLDEYSGLRLSINPYDKELMFVSTVLSQRADYHATVVRWVRAVASMLEIYGDVRRVPISALGRSYQLRRAEVAVRECLRVIELDESPGFESTWDLKRKLLGCKYVGPKVANAYIMFTRRAPYTAPVDIHFQRFVKRLGLLDYRRKPVKSVCSRYACWSCPFRSECLEAAAVENFRALSSWIQTVAYVHDKRYCSRGLCGECRLKKVCSSP
ncbi:hypothetical protein B6U99_01930 [Candidatus Geothermarchaeota archaeon ex4572_27]|nr:MAG: hypothetical protein B6U99_01930 [Candidatus Geothermarchaeota archaeon ex4572_27]